MNGEGLKKITITKNTYYDEEGRVASVDETEEYEYFEPQRSTTHKFTPHVDTSHPV